MKKSILLATALLAACSKPVPHRDEEPSLPNVRYDARQVSADESAPGVNVTSAPGVAFNYSYAFRLPGNRISAVQEAHAAACEKLGIDKCRITGMRYRLVDQKDVQAMLALRLDPKIARQFGKDATGVVEKSDGMLVDQEITGEDVLRATIDGSVLRLRPKLMTVTVVMASLVPIMWSTGVGSDVMKPIAAPIIGGMITSTVHVLIITPVIFYIMKMRALRKGRLKPSGMAA